MADDKLTAKLDEAREAIAAMPREFGTLPLNEARASFAAGALWATAEQLLAAVEAALKLAGDWERKAGERRALAAERQAGGNAIEAWIAQAGAAGREECTRALREAITRELTGKAADVE